MVAMLLYLPVRLNGEDNSPRLSYLATTPDWNHLLQYSGTISERRFRFLLDTVYAYDGAYNGWISLDEGYALIRKCVGDDEGSLRFRFGELDQPGDAYIGKRSTPRYWRTRRELPELTPHLPLRDVRITLDPGHIGGAFAKMEERWFRIGEDPPIREGDLNLTVARILQCRLTSLGADVSMTRDAAQPVTRDTPESLELQARRILGGSTRGIRLDSDIEKTVEKEEDAERALGEFLFYRVSEIRARAQRVNAEFRPDLVLAIHFNAVAWPDSANPSLVDENHLHLIVNGAYLPDEIARDDVRFEMFIKLLQETSEEEVAIAESIAGALAQATDLPPFVYERPGAKRVGDNPYVWARNLLAGRLYRCPVVYLEAYVANSREVYPRLQAGDYPGYRTIDGKSRRSLFREYADGVMSGLLGYFRDNR